MTRKQTAIAKFKGASKSLTVWLNTIALAALPFIDTLQQTLPSLQGSVSGTIYKVLGAVVIVGNILLRFKTNTDLAHK